MKAIHYLIGGLIVALAFSIPFLAMSFSGGGPTGFSGPEQTCNACHGVFGEVNTGTGSVTITAPGTYVAGSTVSITVEVDNTTPPVGQNPRQGFMLSVRDDTLGHVGELDLDGSTLVRFGGAGNTPTDSLYVTHTASSNQMFSWTFSWIAPDDPPNIVTLYAAGNASDADGIPDPDDFVYVTAHSMTRITVANEPDATPSMLSLDPLAPNPFRHDTETSYTLERPATVRVVLRDGRGRTVRELQNGPKEAGTHRLRISAEGLSAGVYFLTVYGPDGARTRPLTLSR